MARKPVDQRENATYHVWSRCAEWRGLIADEYFKALFVEVIALTQEKYEFELNSYTIMDNHIHLLIRTVPGGGTVSKIVQYIKSRFAEKYNRITGRIGPFWNERYKYSIIEDSKNPRRYLLWLLWYLAYNPVRKKMVSDPSKYSFGGINAYLFKEYFSAAKITLHQFFLELGETFKECLAVFLEYETAYRKRLSYIMDW